MGEGSGMGSDGDRARRAAAEAFGVEGAQAPVLGLDQERGERIVRWLERRWRGNPNAATPKGVTRAIGVTTAIVVALISPSSLGLSRSLQGHLIAALIATAVLAGPGWTFERWYRARRRREREHLLPPPKG